MKSSNRELVDRLAAEYVLGTLRSGARRHFERWLVSPQVGAMVKAWEERLSGLEPALQEVRPSDDVWRGIEKKLELRKLDRAPARRWIAIAASLLFFVAVGWFALHQQPQVQQLAATQTALIGKDPQTIYWRVELLGKNQELQLQVREAHELPADKSMELWVLPADGSAPVSLGLLPQTGGEHRVLNDAQRAALAGATRIAVSLEPKGGSPTGHTTGPVLYVAPLQAV